MRAILLLFALIARPGAEDLLPPEFRGEWVPASGDCRSTLRFNVAAQTVTLVNGQDRASYGDVAIAHSFLGPDYRGISVIAIPEFASETTPFTIVFNADEVKGRTRLDIYQETTAPANPRVAAIQAAAKKLAGRFPLHGAALKKCPAGAAR